MVFENRDILIFRGAGSEARAFLKTIIYENRYIFELSGKLVES
jgi:hypothetical protein